MKKLTVIFDGDCVLCRRSVHWLAKRQTYVEIVSVPALHADTMAAYGHIPGYGDNMVVVADDGRFWVGPPDAYLVVMWAIRGTRLLSYVLSAPVLKSLTTWAIRLVTRNRHLIGKIPGRRCEACAAGPAQLSVTEAAT
jgi:predicted DCC family thiol-disulfide oxidoreductase YuxK